VNRPLTNRGLLRAVLVAFVLPLAYWFLATLAATVSLLAAGLLLAGVAGVLVHKLWLRRRVVGMRYVSRVFAVPTSGHKSARSIP
jgi:hypothetical protein